MKAKFVQMHPNSSGELSGAGNAPKSSDSRVANDKQRRKDAQRSFLEGVRARGEAATPDAEGKLPPGALFEEDEKGLLIRSRFSLA